MGEQSNSYTLSRWIIRYQYSCYDCDLLEESCRNSTFVKVEMFSFSVKRGVILMILLEAVICGAAEVCHIEVTAISIFWLPSLADTG